MGVSASRDSSSSINARDGARDHHNARIRVRVVVLMFIFFEKDSATISSLFLLTFKAFATSERASERATN